MKQTLNPSSAPCEPRLFQSFPALNGLRGLLLLWVMYVHSPVEALSGFWLFIRTHLTFGVDGFFAISGFLVTRSLEQCGWLAASRGKSALSALQDFGIRRVSRIWPPYFFCLALIGAIALVLHGGMLAKLVDMGPVLLTYPLFIANYFVANSLDRVEGALVPYWSVSYQEQYYLLLAIALAVVVHMRGWSATQWHGKQRLIRGLSPLLAGGIALSLAIRFVHALYAGPRDAHVVMEMYTHENLDGMAWGCLAWIHYEELGVLFRGAVRARASRWLIGAGTVLVIALRATCHGSMEMALYASIRAPMLALCVRAICESDNSETPFIRLLKNPALQELGKISYEIYLLHALAYAFAFKFQLYDSGLFFVVEWPMAIAAGAAFYYGYSKQATERTKGRLKCWIFGKKKPVLARETALAIR